jgi:hypothetical protein
MEFRLITDNPNNSEPDLSIQLNGRQWYLTKPLRVDLEHPEIPAFTCISYVWGHGREPNPFHPGELMSSNTLRALSAAITHSPNSALWIDALCVPPAIPVKHHTLGSMGYIYSAAEDVIITVPPNLFPILNEMNESDRLSEAVLLSLEQDDWVKSVWTYQEVVNSKGFYFVGGSAKIEGTHFLNCLGHSLMLYKAAHHINAFDLSELLPKLNALEELLVDWMVGGYADRSALRVMAQFQYRYNHDPRNYFYAVVGTMVTGPWPWNMEMTIEQLAEEFMDVCEQKNDYSFIFSANPRDLVDQRGRYWRPVAGLLQAILSWHSWGTGQGGRHDSEGFWLENMISLRPSDGLGDSVRNILGNWLNRIHSDGLNRTDDQIAEQLLVDLRKMSYTGSEHFLWTTHGIFFPQISLTKNAEIEIFIATEVRWMFGAPSLARVTRGEDTQFVPGVFTGEVLKELASDALITRAVPENSLRDNSSTT